MAITIQEKLTVEAPVDRVWDYLNDPEQLVRCLPGAQLDEVVDDRTYAGTAKVKVGPMTIAYKGRMEVVEADAEARRLEMRGKGKEKGGAGTAKVSIVCTVSEEGGASVVRFDAEVDVAGRIVRFGRGMIQEVSSELFQDFAACVRKTLEPSPGEAARSEAAGEAEAPSAGEAPADAAGPEGAETRAAQPAPLPILSILFRALVNVVRRFLRRLFGRGGS